MDPWVWLQLPKKIIIVENSIKILTIVLIWSDTLCNVKWMLPGQRITRDTFIKDDPEISKVYKMWYRAVDTLTVVMMYLLYTLKINALRVCHNRDILSF